MIPPERMGMTILVKKELDKLMGRNLKQMREKRRWSQEHLAELIDSDRRYISAMENGRGIGSRVLQRLCEVFEVKEDAFTKMSVSESSEVYGKLPEVTRMILEELQVLPEYEQLRLLADLKERRAKGGESGR
jgi:transcriptional regulator with XRE-family HTH domain